MDKFAEFRKTQTWQDLRFPLIGLPIITMCISVVAYYFFYAQYEDFLDPISVIMISLIHTVIILVTYLFVPVSIRFLILKRPLKKSAFHAYACTFLLALLAKGFLVVSGISLSKTGTVPFLEFVAVYYVLVCGYDNKPVINWEAGKPV